MQNAARDPGEPAKVDKASEKSPTPNSTSDSSPAKSETETFSEHRGYMSESSESEEDSVSEEFEDDAQAEAAKFLLEDDRAVDPDTQARLEALLQAAGIGQLAAKDGKHLGDPEVLRRLTSSVSCALDEAAAALTRMRSDGAPRPVPAPQGSAAPERAADSLVEACTDGDVGTVRKLLTEGRSVHETSEEGESLLSLACSAGYYELAQVLLAMHANVEDRGMKGECTPLMEAASAGHLDIVRLLVAHGADVNGQSTSGNTPLMYGCAGGHTDVVKFLLENGASVEDHNENGHTPLMEAASAGHVALARVLLQHGAGINTHSNEFKESALTLACYKGHLDMVRFLLEAGADQEHKTDEMHTALMEASMDGHVEVARLLLDSGAQVNMPTDSFESPLTLAACGGHVDLAMLLIERGANIEEVNDEGYTPLMEAAREGHEEMVHLLLGQGKFKGVVKQGANINAQTDETQETALTLACCGGFTEVADILLRGGANIELGASTPLMEAAQEGHLELVRFLLESGADAHKATQTGDTALTYACENGHTDVADLLLQYGAELEHESEGGRTPLMKACRAGHYCTVQFLIAKGANVRRQTSNNDHTPLSLACAGGHLQVVELLLGHNADPNHKLKDNSTMLIEAAKGGHTNVVQLLLDYPHSMQPMAMAAPSQPPGGRDSPGVQTHGGNGGAFFQQPSEVVLQEVPVPVRIGQPDDPNASSQPVEKPDPAPKAPRKTALPKSRSAAAVFDGSLTSAEAQQVRTQPHETDDHAHSPKPGEQEIDPHRLNDFVTARTTHPAEDSKLHLKDELHKVDREVHAKGPQQHVFPYMAQEGVAVPQHVIDMQKQHGLGLFPGAAPPVLQPHGAFYPGPQTGTPCLQSPPLKFAVGDEATAQGAPGPAAFYFAPAGAAQNTQTSTGVVGQAVKFQNVVAHAEVSPNTAISDRPKAKPISKKDGKNIRKQQTFQPSLYGTVQNPQQQQQLFAQQFMQKPDINQEVLSMQALAESLTQIQNEELQKKEDDKKKKKISNAVPPVVLQYQRSPPLKSELEVYDSGQDEKKIEEEELKEEDYTSVEEVVESLEAFSTTEIDDTTQVYPSTLEESVIAQFAVQQPENNPDGTRVEYFAVPAAAAPSGSQQPQVPVHAAFSYEYLAAAAAAGMPKDHQMYQAGFQAGYSHSLMQQQMNSGGTEGGTVVASNVQQGATQQYMQQPNQAACGHIIQQQNVHHCQPCSQHQPSQQVQAATQTNQNANSNPDKKLQKVSDGIKFKKGRVLRHQNQVQNGFHGNNYQIDQNSAITQYSGGSAAQQCPNVVSTPCMDVDSETESNHDTALTLACAGGHEELVELLISRGADIEHRDKKGFTPLILAATAGHEKVVEILLNHNADIEAQSERTKDTPLSLACSGGRYEVVELLLNRNANKEHRNVSDYTPLSLAASGGYVNIIKLLLSHGAEINSRTGSKLGISPLMLAAMNGHTAAVKLLLDMGSDINAQIETNRNTALTLACFQGRHEVVSLLLDRKANVEHRAKTGLTPLMEAASGGYVDVGRVLLDKGADVNATPVPSSRDTALTIAADKGHVRFVELLLCRGAQVEVKNKKGNSPLWLAANGGHIAVVELLYGIHADIDSQDNRKVSCLMAAFRKGHVKVVKWMVGHVNQYPSDQEMMRYIATISDKELLEKCHECVKLIRAAKETQAAKANANASILLEELESEKTREESKRLAAARRRERKKKKKLEKKEERRKLMEENKKNENYDESKDKKQLEDEKNEEEDTVPEVHPANRNNDTNDKEEGDSGIDANSQGSCSSNDLKPKEKRKNKKTKKVPTGTNTTPSPPNKKDDISLRNKPSSSKSKDDTDVIPEKTEKEPKSSKTSSQTTVSTQNTTSNNTSTRKSYENTKSPADRDDFEATGNENYIPSKTVVKHQETVPQQTKSSTNSTSPKQSSNKRDEGWKEVVRKSSVQAVGESGVRKVSVPSNAISRVIGRQGSNINAIRASTGAHIEVEKQSKGQGERIITIKGSTEATKQAHQLIAVLIKDPDVDIMSMLPKVNKTASSATTLWDKTQIGTKKSAGKVVVVSQSTTNVVHQKTVVQSSVSNNTSTSGRFTSTSATKFRGTTPTVASRTTAPRVNEKTSQNVRPTVPLRAVPSKTVIVSSSTNINNSTTSTSNIQQTFAAKLTENPIATTNLNVNVVYSSIVTKPRTTTTTLGVPQSTAGPISPQSQNISVTQNSPNKHIRPALTSSAPPIIQQYQTKPVTTAPFANLNQQNSVGITSTTDTVTNRSVTPIASVQMVPDEQQQQAQSTQSQAALQAANEYTLFYSSADRWARKEQEQQKVNFATVTGSTGQSAGAQYKFIEQEPQVDASKAPGYRGTAVCSPVSSKTSSNSTTPPNISSSFQPYVESKPMGTLPPIGQNLPHRVPPSAPADFMASLMDYKQASTMLGFNDAAGPHLLQSTFGFPPSRLNPKAPEYPNYGKPQAFNGYQQELQQQQQGANVYPPMNKNAGMLDSYGRGLSTQSRFWMQLPQPELMSGLAGMTIHNLQATFQNAEGLENGAELGIVSGSPAMSPAALHADASGYGPGGVPEASERRPPQPIGSGRSRKAYEGGGWPGGDAPPQKWGGLEFAGPQRPPQGAQPPVFGDVDDYGRQLPVDHKYMNGPVAPVAAPYYHQGPMRPDFMADMAKLDLNWDGQQRPDLPDKPQGWNNHWNK